MGNKVTNSEMERRVSVVYDLLLIGSHRAQIIQYVAEKKPEWAISERQIDNYIQRANERFAAHSEVHRAQELGKAIHRLNDLYQRVLKVQDYQRALSVQREINALLGLYAPQIMKIKQEDWRSQALADIKAGLVQYEPLAKAFDDSLAAELFREAGVSIPSGTS